MSNYIVCEDSGVVIGPFADLSSAQAEASSRATAYAADDVSLSVQNTPTYYACIKTRSVTRDMNGVGCVSSTQSIVRFWNITNLVSP